MVGRLQCCAHVSAARPAVEIFESALPSRLSDAADTDAADGVSAEGEHARQSVRLSLVLTACARAFDADLATRAYDLAVRRGLSPDLICENGLILALGRGRRLKAAVHSFRRLLRRLPSVQIERGQGRYWLPETASVLAAIDETTAAAAAASETPPAELRHALNCVLVGCSVARRGDMAFVLLRDAARHGVTPDAFGLAAAMRAWDSWDAAEATGDESSVLRAPSGYAHEAADAPWHREDGPGQGRQRPAADEHHPAADEHHPAANEHHHPVESHSERQLQLLRWGMALGIEPDALCIDTLSGEAALLLQQHELAAVPKAPRAFGCDRRAAISDGGAFLGEDHAEAGETDARRRARAVEGAPAPTGVRVAPAQQTNPAAGLLDHVQPYLQMLAPLLQGSDASAAPRAAGGGVARASGGWAKLDERSSTGGAPARSDAVDVSRMGRSNTSELLKAVSRTFDRSTVGPPKE